MIVDFVLITERVRGPRGEMGLGAGAKMGFGVWGKNGVCRGFFLLLFARMPFKKV